MVKGLKELHKMLGVHDPQLWTTKSKDDDMKVCSCGTIWWNGEERIDWNDGVVGKFWYFGPTAPPILTEIAISMGTKGTACACGLLPMEEMANSTEHETHMFARTMSDMITFKRPLPPSQSVASVIGERLLEHDEMRLMLDMKALDLFS
jgi:hypothetical protein